MSDLEANKLTAERFLRTAFEEGRPAEAVERYVGASYRQHSATAADGSAAFIAFAQGLAAERPNLRLNIKRVLGDGDLVALHMHVTGLDDGDDGRGHALVDIFRFDESGRIVEHWDVIQPVPPAIVHDNGLF